MNISEVKMTDAEALFDFCTRLREEHAEMSFADVTSIKDVISWD